MPFIEKPTPIIVMELQQTQLEVPLCESIRDMRSKILNDYIVYLQEHEFDIRLEDDPISFSLVKQSVNSKKWMDVMKDEMKSMEYNGV